MNVAALIDKLSGDQSAVEHVLESIGCYPIRFDHTRQQFRFARDGGTNASSVVLDLNTLRFYCFSTNQKGNLISLTMQRRNCSFVDAMRYILALLGWESAELTMNVQKPFGGFFSSVHKAMENPEDALPVYDEQILQPYLNKYNLRFLNDGIDFQTQARFQVGYDIYSDRITVPEWTMDGRLCGIMGRANDANTPHEYRWLPIIPCSRSLTLYGYHRKYAEIQKRRTVLLFESEKAVMQCAAMFNHNALAVCGCRISDVQARYIKALRTNKIVVCFDEGLAEDQVRTECERLKIDNPFLKNQIGYVWDADGQILKHGEKQNAADMGHEKCKYLLHHNIKWL